MRPEDFRFLHGKIAPEAAAHAGLVDITTRLRGGPARPGQRARAVTGPVGQASVHQPMRPAGPPRPTALAVFHAPRGPARTDDARILQLPTRLASGWGKTAPSLRLPKPLQAKLEREHGVDLDRVRVRLGRAPALIGAQALTLEDQLHFDPAAYRPTSAAGEALIRDQVHWVVQPWWAQAGAVAGVTLGGYFGGWLGAGLGAGLGFLAGTAVGSVIDYVRRDRPTIHFVWFGNGAPTPANTHSPIRIAALIDANVIFWCEPGVVVAFETALGRTVSVRSLATIRAPLVARLGLPFAGRVNSILEFYRANRGFAPAKDLLTFLILAVHGGYFFDANCVVDEADQFRRAVTHTRRFPAFISLPTTIEFNPGRPRDLDYIALTIGGGGPEFHETDMWAMYGPPGHAMFWRIVQEYVERAEALGIVEQAPNAPTEAQLDGRETFRHGGDRAKRSIAGAIGTMSIFAGMYAHRADPGYRAGAANWSADRVENRAVLSGRDRNKRLAHDADYWVPELGLSKGHGGTW